MPAMHVQRDAPPYILVPHVKVDRATGTRPYMRIGTSAVSTCGRSDAGELEAEELGPLLGVAQQRAEQQVERL